jgi:hypothetical protein
MSNAQELEKKIMDCWSIIDDIDTTLSIIDRTACDEDTVLNALIGLRAIYEEKFRSTFSVYEKLLKEFCEAENIKVNPNANNTGTPVYTYAPYSTSVTYINTDHPTGTTVTYASVPQSTTEELK